MSTHAEDRTEVPRTLDEAPPPRLLGLWDQLALWWNLGISLLLLVAAQFVIDPLHDGRPLSLAAALTAVVVGSVIGNLLLGLGALPGSETGAPGMVLLRGLLGRRGSWVPTGFNVLQLVGWTTFEIVVIAEAATELTSPGWRWVFVVGAGALATFMAIRPLGVVRGYLKRVAVWVVLASTAYLFIQVLRQPLDRIEGGDWHNFWKGADIVIALAVSWIPLAPDYARHARDGRSAFLGAFLGYGAASTVFFSLGVLTYAAYGGDDLIASLLAIPVGGLALLTLIIDELDEVFANLYSTVVSVQNLRPSFDRRVLAIAMGVVATALALEFDIHSYENFLLLLGSVFVPLFATFATDYFLISRRAWDVSDDAKPRWQMLVPWALGFVMYQLVNPGTVEWWASWWLDLGFESPSWASASIASFATAGGATLLMGRLSRRTRQSSNDTLG
jgi:putative hydroxymethylpyrimidine transporter CytX